MMKIGNIHNWKLLIIVTLTAFSMIGCQGGRKITQPTPAADLTESQLREYHYALTEATKQKLFGNFKQAAALYSKCIEVNPTSDVAYFQLSGIYMMGRQIDNAKSLNLKATVLNPENYWYKIQLAQLYMMSQVPDSAVLVYEEIIEKWPDKIEIQYELSRLYSETGKDTKALKILNNIEAEKGISEPVSMLKEQIYVKQSNYEQAIIELNKLIEVAPEDIRYLGILAELYTTLERKQEARETYRKIFEIEPENGIAQLSMAEFYRLDNDKEKQFQYIEMAFRNKSLQVENKMGVLIEYLTDEETFRENEIWIDSMILVLSEIHPADFRVKTAKADFLSKQEKYEEASAVYKEILDEQKGNYFIWEQAIFIENILGNSENVYNQCSEALEYFPDKPFLYMFLGNSAMQLDKNEEAIVSLEKGLPYVENNIPLIVQFYSFLAEAWRNLDDFEKSDEYFEKALEMDPENILILNNYGYYLSLREENLEKAEKMSRKTIKMEPENATYLDTYAWILFKMEKIKEAREYIEKAMKFGGDEDPDVLEHYGDILKALGMHEKAREQWIKAREKGSKSKELESKISE